MIFSLLLLYSSQVIWSGSKKFIKVVLTQERILALGFRTALMKGFDPLQMVTSVFLLIYFLALLYFLTVMPIKPFIWFWEREPKIIL